MALQLRCEPELPSIVLPHTLQDFMPPAVDSIGQLSPRNYEFFQHSSEVPFSPDRRDYSPAAAWLLSDCAFLAYSNRSIERDVEDEIRPALSRLFREPPELKVFIGSAYCWNRMAPDDRIQCYVAHNGSWGVVAFRGTLPNSMSNWLTDAEFVLEAETGSSSVRVHRGFKAALDCLWEQDDQCGLERYLNDQLAKYPNLKLWFTGHSLGAGLAALAVHRLQRAQALYTFGSPKIGNRAFVDEMNRLRVPHFRIVNHRDIMTTLPTLHSFEHCGVPKYLQHPGSFKRNWRWLLATLGFGKKANDGGHLHGLFDNMSKLGHGFQEHVGILRACLDHCPIFYSKNLWNKMVRSITPRTDNH